MFFKSVFINERKGLLASEDPIPVDHELFQFSCCPRHDYKTMLDLVESDPGVINRVVGGCKKTLLHRCIEYHRPCMVEYLLKKDALQLMDAAGNVPLHIAASVGNADVAEMLIKHGAEVDAVNKEGDRPLHLAAETGNLPTVLCLLGHGAQVDSSGWRGSSALHAASENGHVDVMKILIDRGVDVTIVNKLRETPLHLASGSDNINSLESVELLLENGAHMSAK